MIAASAAGTWSVPAAPPGPQRGGAGRDGPLFFVVALPLGIGLLAYHVMARFDLASLLGSWQWWAITLFRTQTTALAIAACVALVHRRVGRGSRPRLLEAAAVVAGSAVAAAAALALLHWTGLPYGGPSAPRWVLYIQLEYMLLAGGAVFALLDRRRAREVQDRLLAARRGRLEAARRTLEVRLQATQARVEPQLLFDTLAAVHRLHAQDAARAERLLDALIAYLRAAMPSAAESASTIDQEIALVRAWLALAAGASEGGIDVCIEVARDAGNATVPPMLVLPLVRCVLARGPRPGREHRYLRLAIRIEQSRLEVRVASNAPGVRAGRDEALANLRERLSALYGAAASLALDEGPQGDVEAVLDVPLERAPLAPARGATDRSAS
jgi:hypothetical protein